MVKATFTFDDETVRILRRTAERLARSQSLVVREAIREYAQRAGKLTEDERRRLLDVFDTMLPNIPRRPTADADAELREIRAARRRGGRRHPSP
jgi:hypothetical protein